MSLEDVVKIGKLAISDEKLRTELMAEVKGKTNAEAAIAAAAFAKRHGFEATPAEVEQGYKIYQKLRKGGEGELSEEELALVSGGGSKGDPPDPTIGAGEKGGAGEAFAGATGGGFGGY
jgi:hypothetical protein